MRLPLELVVALRDARGAPEVVDRDRLVPALGEAERELLVEAVEPADVREDHDPGAARLVRGGGERGEPVPVPGLEDERPRARPHAPEITGIGGSESRSKHTAARLYLRARSALASSSRRARGEACARITLPGEDQVSAPAFRGFRAQARAAHRSRRLRRAARTRADVGLRRLRRRRRRRRRDSRGRPRPPTSSPSPPRTPRRCAPRSRRRRRNRRTTSSVFACSRTAPT